MPAPEIPTPYMLIVFGRYPCPFTEHAMNTLMDKKIPFIYKGQEDLEEDNAVFLRPISRFSSKRSLPAIVLLKKVRRNHYHSVAFSDNSAETTRELLATANIPKLLHNCLVSDKRGLSIRDVLPTVKKLAIGKKKYEEGSSFVFHPVM